MLLSQYYSAFEKKPIGKIHIVHPSYNDSQSRYLLLCGQKVSQLKSTIREGKLGDVTCNNCLYRHNR